MRTSWALLLPLVPLVALSAPRLGPPGLRGLPQSLASFLGTDVAPTSSAEANGLPFYWRRGEFSARDVEHLQCEVEEDLRRKSGLSHDSAERHRSSDAQTRRQF